MKARGEGGEGREEIDTFVLLIRGARINFLPDVARRDEQRMRPMSLRKLGF